MGNAKIYASVHAHGSINTLSRNISNKERKLSHKRTRQQSKRIINENTH